MEQWNNASKLYLNMEIYWCALKKKVCECNEFMATFMYSVDSFDFSLITAAQTPLLPESHRKKRSYLITSLDLCTFSHQHLDDLNVATAGCNQKGGSPMLQQKHTSANPLFTRQPLHRAIPPPTYNIAIFTVSLFSFILPFNVCNNIKSLLHVNRKQKNSGQPSKWSDNLTKSMKDNMVTANFINHALIEHD